MTTVGIMQPYFFPYVGYFQLINSTDLFVIYDDVQYTKKGWINRNKVRDDQGCAKQITVNVNRASEKSLIREISISSDYSRKKMKAKLDGFYAHSIFRDEANQILFPMIDFTSQSLFEYLQNSISQLLNVLQIPSKLLVSSNIGDFTSLKKQQKVIAINKILQSTSYLNPQSGIPMYEPEVFSEDNIALKSFVSEVHNDDKIFQDNAEIPLSIIHSLYTSGLEATKNKVRLGKVITQ